MERINIIKKLSIFSILLLVLVSSAFAFTPTIEVGGISAEDVQVFMNESHVTFSTSYLDATIEHIDFFVPNELQDDFGYVTPCAVNNGFICQGTERDPIYNFDKLFHIKTDPNAGESRFYLLTDYIFTYPQYDPDGDIPTGFNWKRINQEISMNYNPNNKEGEIFTNWDDSDIKYNVYSDGFDVVIEYTYYNQGQVVATFERRLSPNNPPSDSSVVFNFKEDAKVDIALSIDDNGNITRVQSGLFVDGNKANLKYGANASEYFANDAELKRAIYRLRSDNPIVKDKGNYMLNADGGRYRMDFSDICSFEYANCSYEYYEITSDNVTTYNLGVSFMTKSFIDPAFVFEQTSVNLYQDTQFEYNGNVHLDINSTNERYAVFDGSGDSVQSEMSDFPIWDGNTISIWVNPDVSGGNRGYLTATQGTTFNFLQLFSQGNVIYRMREGATTHDVNIGSTAPVGVWTHYVARYDPLTSNMTVWENGVVVNNKTVVAGTDSYTIDRTYLGVLSGTTYPFDGSIDEAMLFKRAITDEEIQNIYNLNRTDYNGSKQDLLGYWNFDNQPIWNDKTVNKFNAIPNGDVYAELYNSSEPQYQTPNTPYDSLIAYYSFDADSSTTAYDLTANNNDGTYSAGTSFSTGIYGKAFTNDGTGDLDIGDFQDFDDIGTGNFAISTWVKSSDVSSNGMRIVEQYSSVSPFNGVQVWFRPSDNKIQAWTQNGVAYTIDTTAYDLADGNWHQVAFVRNSSSELVLYVDGLVAVHGTGKSAGSLDVDSRVFNIGSSSTFSDWNGSIDDFMVFNNGLTESQILDIYNNQSSRFKPQGNVTYSIVKLNESANKINLTLENRTALLDSSVYGAVGYWQEAYGYDYDSSYLDTEAILYYQANNNATDMSNGNHNGTLQGNTAYADGVFEEGFVFDGTTDYVNIDTTQHLLYRQDNPVAISVWFKTDDVANIRKLYSESVTLGQVVSFGIHSDSRLRFAYRGASNWADIFSEDALEADTWYHAVVNYDQSAGTGTMYINGKDVTSSTVVYSGYLTAYAFDDAIVGATASSFSQSFDGVIDEIMLFNRSLNTDEVAYLFTDSFLNWRYSDSEEYITDEIELSIPASDIIKPITILDASDFNFYTPYLLTGGVGVTFAQAPTVEFIQPTTFIPLEGQTYIELTTQSEITDYTEIRLYNSTGLYALYNTTNLTQSLNYTGLAFGDYSFNATACNGISCVSTNTTIITLTPDATPPNITVHSPLNNSEWKINQAFFNITITDSSSINTTIESDYESYNSTSNTIEVYVGNTLGTYDFNITSIDSFGNEAKEYRTLTIKPLDTLYLNYTLTDFSDQLPEVVCFGLRNNKEVCFDENGVI